MVFKVITKSGWAVLKNIWTILFSTINKCSKSKERFFYNSLLDSFYKTIVCLKLHELLKWIKYHEIEGL